MSAGGTHFLDTNALIALMERGLVAEPGALVSVMVLAELSVGVSQADSPERERARVRKAMGTAQIVFPTARTASIYGQIVAKLKPCKKRRAAGVPPGPGMIPVNDVWIAALALEHDLPLYAADKHFKGVEGLKFHPCATPQDVLHVVTLNTSDVHPLYRKASGEPAIGKIKNILRQNWSQARTHEGITLAGGEVRLMRLSLNLGSATFGLWQEDPIIACLACWNPSRSQVVWERAEGSFFEFEELYRDSNFRLDLSYNSHDPPTLPWLSIVLMPPLSGQVPADEAGVGDAFLLALGAIWALMDLEREGMTTAS